MIEQYCYSPPYPNDSESYNAKTKSKSRKNGTPLKHTSQLGCRHATSHLSLLLVCRQLHEEVFFIFVDAHIFKFSDPKLFANKFLSFLPNHQLQQLRHLSLEWPATRRCGRQASWNSAGCQNPKTHQTINDDVDVKTDMRNFMKVWDLYPELVTNLDSIKFTLPMPCDHYFGSYLDRLTTNFLELLRHTFWMVQSLDERFQEFPASACFLLGGHLKAPNTLVLIVHRCEETDWNAIPHFNVLNVDRNQYHADARIMSLPDIVARILEGKHEWHHFSQHNVRYLHEQSHKPPSTKSVKVVLGSEKLLSAWQEAVSNYHPSLSPRPAQRKTKKRKQSNVG